MALKDIVAQAIVDAKQQVAALAKSQTVLVKGEVVDKPRAAHPGQKAKAAAAAVQARASEVLAAVADEVAAAL